MNGINFLYLFSKNKTKQNPYKGSMGSKVVMYTLGIMNGPCGFRMGNWVLLISILQRCRPSFKINFDCHYIVRHRPLLFGACTFNQNTYINAKFAKHCSATRQCRDMLPLEKSIVVYIKCPLRNQGHHVPTTTMNSFHHWTC